ncbi:RHS repeat-associated core domain-containing protein [Duganella sp. Root1480D1]|uniref:RHS repeat-associated core domain-containing protein n=1 Tax=Duganella sp. Root1480D1 TaxID=1736471 RepID=UPI0007092566|nr:RHS repeat-associated core domain-containing protein [Duganella sp. Root1480D1]KQZ44023.1 hypothetical protein ASD58_19990 [Duganella sp. Root1480D1]
MCPAAARFNDPIAHTSTMGMLAKMGGSLLIGALVGAAITAVVVAAVVATVATGGLGLAAVLAIGFGVSVAMEASGLNGFIDNQVNRAVDKFIPPSIEGKIVSGSPDVKFNSLPAARAAAPGELDTIACNKHSSGPAPMLAQGSDNVFINDQPAARKGDMTTCGGTIAEGSENVFVGGGTLTVREIKDERPWWITALGVAIGIALTLCGRGKMNLSALKSALPCLLLNFGASFAGSMVGHQIRTAIGNPVNVITGGKVLNDPPDFSLAGPLALSWERFYSSHDHRADGLLGRGWSVPFELELKVVRDSTGMLTALEFTDAQGRTMAFPPVLPGESHYSTAEGYYLICTELGQYLIESVDGLYFDFGVPDPGFGATLKLQRIEDRNGNWNALRYDNAGKLRKLNDSCGRTLELHYSPAHPLRVERIELVQGIEGEPAETLVCYGYDLEGQLAEVIGRDRQVRRWFAYQDGLMSEHRSAAGLRCHYAWSGSGPGARVLRHWTDDGEAYDFEYDLNHGVTTVTDQIGRVNRWEWSRDCQPTSFTDPEGNTWHYDWDERRRLTQMTDPLGACTQWEYDEAGRMVKCISALGQIESVQWHDRLNLPTAEIDAAGNRTEYHYDKVGNLTAITDPLGHVTEQFHDARGLPHTLRDASGGVKHLEWNARAQLTAHVDCSGKRTVYAYDARGSLARSVDAVGQATIYAADDHGRIVSIVHPDGAQENFEYDAAGRLSASQTGGDRITRYERNARGLITRRRNALGRSVEFRYDAAFRLVELVNENEESYRFAYDKNDRVIAEVGLDGVTKRIAYDQRGLAVAVTSAAGESDELTLRMERDLMGRLTCRHARGFSTSFRYDQLGQLVHAATFSEYRGVRKVFDELAFAYSKRGELLSETGHMGMLAHSYDELGNRVSTTLPDGRVIQSLHYGSGHVHQINLDGELICDLERDDLHREVGRSQGVLSTSFNYDAMGRRTRTQSVRDGRAVLAKEWAYGESGEVVRKDHSLNGRTSFMYDPLGRISYAGQEARREMFQWDGAANLVDSVQPGGYVRHNRVLVFQDRRFEYDVHGRLESKRTGAHTVQHFSYDGEHRLSQVETCRKGVTQVVRFDYDAVGRRIRKHDEFGTTLFLWNGMNLLQEQRGAQAATYLYEVNSHVPVARIDSVVEGETLGEGDARHARPKASTYYFHCDVSGLPEELSAASGEFAWRAQYQMWGNTVTESWTAEQEGGSGQHGSPLPQNLRFQGQYHDRESGLHYNTFRYYDPDIGHFTTPDPIGLAGGVNLYQYAPNPISWIDPWGWNSHGVYDVHGEAKLPSEMYRMSDGRHFQEANRQLYYQMKNDPQFKAAIEAKYPGTFDAVSPGRRGAFPRTAPPALTWHHHEKVGGLLQLVDQADHNARHKDYHPTGRGGRNTWGGGSKCR